MRSLAVLAVVLGAVPAIILFPHIGVLIWSWLSYMNPHRLTWGLATNFHVGDVIAVATLVAWLISKEPKVLVRHPLVYLLGIYAVWVTITSIFALNPADAWIKWEQFLKIIFFTFVTIGLITSPNRLKSLIWVMAISLGFYGLKGGLFTITSGGGYHVLGPSGSFISDNNGLALALIMLLPLVRFLHLSTQNQMLRWGLGVSMPLIVLAIFGSQSRGAFVGIAAMMAVLLWRSQKRFYILGLIVIAMVVALSFMPPSWTERMWSITEYQTDASAQGRLEMWGFAFEVAAAHPIVGGGFNVFWDSDIVTSFVPDTTFARAAHSNYFEVLGEHGYIGLALYLLILSGTYYTAGSISRRCRGHPEVKWADDLARMVQVSLVGYASAGAFLTLATFDMFYLLVAIMVITHELVNRQLAVLSPVGGTKTQLSWQRPVMPHSAFQHHNQPKLGHSTDPQD